MKFEDDLILYMIGLLQHALGENSFTENVAEQVEHQVRSKYGGGTVYIAKHSSEVRRKLVLRKFNGRNRNEVCDELGLSKAQFYRYLKGG